MNVRLYVVVVAISGLVTLARTEYAAQAAEQHRDSLKDPAVILAAVQAHSDQLSDVHVLYSQRILPNENWWQTEFWGLGSWFRVKSPTSEVGFDGVTYYLLDRANTSAWLGAAPPESPIDSIHDPRYIGTLDPKLMSYLKAHSSQLGVDADPSDANMCLVMMTVPKEDISTAFNGVAAANFGGVSVKLWVNVEQGYTLQREELRGSMAPTKGLLGVRQVWSGWTQDANGLWFPRSHRFETYGVPQTAGAAEPLIFCEEYRYDEVETHRGLSQIAFTPPAIPAGYVVTDARGARHQNVFVAKPVSDVATHPPGTLAALGSGPSVGSVLGAGTIPKGAGTAISPTRRAPVNPLLIYSIAVIGATVAAIGISLAIKFRRKRGQP